MKGRNVQSDAEKQIQDALHGSEDAKEALLIRASLFSSSSVGLIISQRHKERDELEEDMRKLLRKATWLSKQPEAKDCGNFDDFKTRIRTNAFHDYSCLSRIKLMITTAEAEYDPDHWKEFYTKEKPKKKDKKDKNVPELEPYPKGQNDNSNTRHLTMIAASLRHTTTKLSKLAETIVGHHRSMRFMQSILRLQSVEIACSHCYRQAPSLEVTLLGACGHVGCQECVSLNCEECPVRGCSAIIKPHSRYSSRDFTQRPSMKSPVDGQKIDEIVARIMHIIQQGKGNHKILLFAQFPQLIREIREALKANEISFLDLTIGKDQSKNLQKFQKQSPNLQYEVCLVNPSESSAAGANLTVANHVIFAHALHTKGPGGQSQWKATMTQAVGRALRWGQQRKVHIYHYFSVGTIDIDIIEHRTGMIVTRHPDHDRRALGQGALVRPTYIGEEGVEVVVRSTLSSAIANIHFPSGRETDEILDVQQLFGHLATLEDDDIANNDMLVGHGENGNAEHSNEQGISPTFSELQVAQPNVSRLNRSKFAARVANMGALVSKIKLDDELAELSKDLAEEFEKEPPVLHHKGASAKSKRAARAPRKRSSTAGKQPKRAPAQGRSTTSRKKSRISSPIDDTEEDVTMEDSTHLEDSDLEDAMEIDRPVQRVYGLRDSARQDLRPTDNPSDYEDEDKENHERVREDGDSDDSEFNPDVNKGKAKKTRNAPSKTA